MQSMYDYDAGCLDEIYEAVMEMFRMMLAKLILVHRRSDLYSLMPELPYHEWEENLPEEYKDICGNKE